MASETVTSPAGKSVSTPRLVRWFAPRLVAMPVTSLGGAIAALGGAGAVGCYRVARRDDLSSSARVAICSAIATLCWVGFVTAGALVAAVL